MQGKSDPLSVEIPPPKKCIKTLSLSPHPTEKDNTPSPTDRHKHTGEGARDVTQRFVLRLDAPAGRGKPRSGSAARLVLRDGQQGAPQLQEREPQEVHTKHAI